MNRFPVQLHRMEPELVIMRIAVIRKPVIPRLLIKQSGATGVPDHGTTRHDRR